VLTRHENANDLFIGMRATGPFVFLRRLELLKNSKFRTESHPVAHHSSIQSNKKINTHLLQFEKVSAVAGIYHNYLIINFFYFSAGGSKGAI
jgi:hypothetical protein